MKAGRTKAGKQDATDPKSAVQSLAKAFRVLEAIAASEADMTLSEVAAMANLDPGTTHRMLNTMVNLGYVARSDSKHFTLTLKILDLGFRAIGHRDIRSLARPLLRSLVGEVSEAASIGVLSGTDVLYVDRMRAGITRLGVDIRIGTVIPATTSMIGWAMLAYLPDTELDKLLKLAAHTPGPKDLRTQLKAVRKQGYVLNDSQFSGGLGILAVPVLDKDGYPLAAISVAAPVVRMSLTELKKRALTSVQSVAKQIARGLEASGGTTAL